MPYSKDISDFQKWIDGMFNPNYDPFVELEKIAARCGIEVDNKKQTVTIKNPVSPFEIQSVLSNRKKNAFTVVWTDGTHTTVHCQSGDEWDDEKALAMCFTKKALGNKGNFNDKFNHALDIMKTIPEEKKTIPANEVCNCDGTCTECKCEKLTNAFGVDKQTATELSKAAGKASNSLKEMIDALTNEKPKYKAYLQTVHTGDNILLIGTGTTMELHKILAKYARDNDFTGYSRYWEANGGLYIDFGSHSRYFYIPSMTMEEWSK